MGIERIGYTTDGLIFMIIEGQYEGEPMKTISQMPIETAKQINLALASAIQGAEEAMRKFQDERNGLNAN